MIKKNYYTESLKQLEEMDNELRKIQESMTEEEKLTEKEKAQRGFQRLVERFEREESETRRIVNQKKKEYFAVLVKTGLALAKIVEADFEAAIRKGRSLGMSNQEITEVFMIVLED